MESHTLCLLIVQLKLLFKTLGNVKGKMCSSKGQLLPTGGGRELMGNTNDSFSVTCIFTACTWTVIDSVAVRVIKTVQMRHIDTESFFQKVTYP